MVTTSLHKHPTQCSTAIPANALRRLEKWVVSLVKSTVAASNRVSDLECCYWLLNSVVCYCDNSDYFSAPNNLVNVL